MSNSPQVTVNPRKLSGAPTIDGHRISVDQIAGEYPHHASAEVYGEAYQLTRKQVLTALWFVGIYGFHERTRKGQRIKKKAPRWLNQWALEVEGHMWSGDWHKIQDPQPEEKK
jgi:uncharacterized protein (DUF433 family)